VDAKYEKSLKNIAKIMERARDHASSVADEKIEQAMREFAKKLKPSTALEFYCGMGTYGFIIKRAGKPQLWINSQDTYYSREHSATFDVGRGEMVRDWTFPLVETLNFLDRVNSEWSIWFNEYKVPGSKTRIVR
jgi:hypothetical protein